MESKYAEPIGWHVVKGKNMIGFETGQIRPGKLGQHDMLNFLLQAGYGPPNTALFVCGLFQSPF